jgi:hypothetical protein
MAELEDVQHGNVLHQTGLGRSLCVSGEQDRVEDGNNDGGVVVVACQRSVGVESGTHADDDTARLCEMQQVFNTFAVRYPELPNRQVMDNRSKSRDVVGMIVCGNDHVELGAAGSSQIMQDICSTRPGVHKPSGPVRLVDDEAVALTDVQNRQPVLWQLSWPEDDEVNG